MACIRQGCQPLARRAANLCRCREPPDHVFVELKPRGRRIIGSIPEHIVGLNPQGFLEEEIGCAALWAFGIVLNLSPVADATGKDISPSGLRGSQLGLCPQTCKTRSKKPEGT